MKSTERLVDALSALRDAVILQNRLGATWHREVFPKMMSALSDADVALIEASEITQEEQEFGQRKDL